MQAKRHIDRIESNDCGAALNLTRMCKITWPVGSFLQ